MIIVLGEAQAAPGRLEELRAAARAASAAATDTGCASYGFFADVIRPDVILSVEIWHDQESLDAHMHHEHTREFLEVVPHLVAGSPTLRLFEAYPQENHR